RRAVRRHPLRRYRGGAVPRRGRAAARGARHGRGDGHLALSRRCARRRGAGAQRRCGPRPRPRARAAPVSPVRAMTWRRYGALLLVLAACTAYAEEPLRIGSKRFTESYILGEILARATGGEHKPGLGNTGIVLAALRAGAIDVYPEYTGTIAAEIVRLPAGATLEELNRALAADGLAAGVPLG